MSDIEQKRAWVAELYPSESWKRKVRHMPEAQIVAIYMREQNRPSHHEPYTQESEDASPPF